MLQMEVTDSTLDLLYRELDQTPDDRNLLLAISDRHEELETGLNRGFQALTACGRVPFQSVWSICWWDLAITSQKINPVWNITRRASLPNSWYKIVDASNTGVCGPCPYPKTVHSCYLVAAEAFNRLTLDQQEKLLQGDMNI